MKRMRQMFSAIIFSSFVFVAGAKQPLVMQEQSNQAVVNKVHTIDRVEVEKQKKQVLAYLAKNKTHRIMVRTATVTAMAAVVGYGIYHMWFKGPDTATTTNVPVKDLTEATRHLETMKDKITLLELKMAKEYKIPLTEAVVETPTTYAGVAAVWAKDAATAGFGVLKYVGNVILSTGPPMFMTTLALRELPTVADLWGRFVTVPVDKICHPSDSRWFLKNRVHYKEMFVHLGERVNGLPLASDDQERNYFVSQIITDLNVLTDQLAKVVAFLEIQAERVTKKNKVCGAHLTQKSDHIFNLIKKFNNEISLLLEEKSKHAEIPARFSELERKLKDEFYSFDLYERAAFHDIIPL